MKFYNVNTKEYIANGEFIRIAEFISSIKKSRAERLAIRYSDYKIKPRTIEDSDLHSSINIHLQRTNMPFYDSLLCETLIHKQGCGYIDLQEYTFQLNIFCKTIFHRRRWNPYKLGGPDKFLNFVWEDWKQTQPNFEFDILEQHANTIFDNSENLLEYHKNFVYNDDYQFVTEKDMRELFDGLVNQNIWLSKQDNLYQVYENVDYDDVVTDSKNNYYLGNVSKFDEIHIRAKFSEHNKKMRQIRSKVNFVPRNEQSGFFDGFWSEHKLNGKVYFIPQFLVFYS